jgi:hypothetical protein
MNAKRVSVELCAHPACGELGAVGAVTVDVTATPKLLRLSYDLRSRVAIKIPGLRAERASRCNELWLHTCCEFFTRDPEQAGPYREFNFSPAGDWASYAFDDTRRGMRSPPWPGSVEPPEVKSTMEQAKSGLFRHRLVVDLSIPRAVLGSQSQLFPTVVLETMAGTSLWAIWHPTDRPNFHHPDNFLRALEIP